MCKSISLSGRMESLLLETNVCILVATKLNLNSRGKWLAAFGVVT